MKITNPYSDLLPIKPKIKLKKQQKIFTKKQTSKSKFSKQKNKDLTKKISCLPGVGGQDKFIQQEGELLPTIQIDYREKNSLVPTTLKSLGHTIKLKELKVGDYLINETIIERKEINDLVQSIKNKRIFKQIEEMKQYPNQLLIIEGNIYSQKSLHPNAIKGFILSTSINQKTPIIFTSNAQETSKYISILANKKNSNFSINPSKKKLNFFETQNHILQAFPEIGPKTSTKLLEKFTTLKRIFNAQDKELEPILNKKTQKFLKLLN